MRFIYKVYFFLLFFLLHSELYSQNCNLVSNGDFETFTSCPTSSGQMNRATGWYQGTTSGGSSDFFHSTCGFMNVGGGITPSMPFPNGVGCAGVYTNYNSSQPYYKEETGQFLNFCAGQKYKFEIYLSKPSTGSYVNMLNNFSLQIGNTAVLPTTFTPVTLCPTGFVEQTNITGSLITSSWQKFTRTFTATQNANAFILAGSCAGPFNAAGYAFFDDVIISTVDTLTASPTSVTTCDSASFTLTIPGGCYGPYDIVINSGTTIDTIFNINSGYVHTVHPTQTTTYTITSIINSFGCATLLAVPVSVSFGSIQSTVNASICNGGNYTLPGGGIVSASGVYKDTLLSSGGCDSIITTNLSVGSTVTSSQNISICTGNSFTLPGGLVVSSAGTYIDTINTSTGCDSIITTVLTVNSSITVSQSATICAGNTYLLPSGQNVSIAGTYMDTIPASGGCDSIITTILTVNPNTGSIQNPIICSGALYILPSGATASVSGTYTFTSTASNGCDSVITTNLTVNPKPNATVSSDVTILSGSSTTLSASGGASYVWSPSTNLNSVTGNAVVANPVSNIIYCVTVSDANGCSDSSCIKVTVETTCGTFYIPNAFSSNGDNENDEFKVYINPLCVTKFLLIIYDRWGDKVFETNDITKGWNGELRGVVSNSAVYTFYCKTVLISGEEIFKQGNVSLVR